MSIVIGLLGRAGSGKSTAAKYLVERYGAKTFSLARPLKDLCKLLFDFTDEQVFGSQAQKETIDSRYGISPRTAMIRLGDGAREILWKRIWIDTCFKQIEQSGVKLSVIEDVRYPNEAEWINGVPSGYVVKLVCPDSDSSPEYANAPSEIGVDQCNPSHIYETIVSRKSPGSIDLKRQIDLVMRCIIAEAG